MAAHTVFESWIDGSHLRTSLLLLLRFPKLVPYLALFGVGPFRQLRSQRPFLTLVLSDSFAAGEVVRDTSMMHEVGRDGCREAMFGSRHHDDDHGAIVGSGRRSVPMKG